MVVTLNLQDFLIRARVLKLYKQALRISRRAPPHSKDELRKIARQEMESNRNCDDKQRIRFLISDGLERLKRLDETLEFGHAGSLIPEICNLLVIFRIAKDLDFMREYEIDNRNLLHSFVVSCFWKDLLAKAARSD